MEPRYGVSSVSTMARLPVIAAAPTAARTRKIPCQEVTCSSAAPSTGATAGATRTMDWTTASTTMRLLPSNTSLITAVATAVTPPPPTAWSTRKTMSS